jgi:hypothetical protein
MLSQARFRWSPSSTGPVSVSIAPATSQGPASDDDTGGGGDESLPARLTNVQQFDANDDDEREDEGCDGHELELESKRQPRVSALGKTKARAKSSAIMPVSRGVVVLGSGKRKQASGATTEQWRCFGAPSGLNGLFAGSTVDVTN